MIEEIEENIRNRIGLTESQMDLIKVILMLGLIITMIFLGIVIWKYGDAIKSNPCSLCDCSVRILKGGIN